MILPQLVQFGAVVKSGCIEALQSHLRLSLESVGLVDNSSAAMADVKSAILDVVAVLVPRGVDVPECD